MSTNPILEFSLKTLSHSHITLWENVLSRILSYKSRKYAIDKSQESFIIYNESNAFETFQKKYGYLGEESILVGRTTESDEDITIATKFLRDIYEHVEDPQICDITIAEALAKIIAYRSLPKGYQIEIPTLCGNKMRPRKYVVDETFNLWNDLKAYGLRCIDAPEYPILLFRGTDFSLLDRGSRTSIACNFDPKGPGRSIYLYARPQLRRWLKSVCKKGLKARTFGFSLGGALASYALIDDSEFFSQDPERCSYLFSHPGLQSDLFNKYESLQDKPYIQGFVNEGDFVSKYANLFGETYTLYTDHQYEPIKSHTSLYLVKSTCYIAPVQLTRENRSLSRKRYTQIHKTNSNFLYNMGLRLLLPTS